MKLINNSFQINNLLERKNLKYFYVIHINHINTLEKKTDLWGKIFDISRYSQSQIKNLNGWKQNSFIKYLLNMYLKY